jgi:hypothetical protein
VDICLQYLIRLHGAELKQRGKVKYLFNFYLAVFLILLALCPVWFHLRIWRKKLCSFIFVSNRIDRGFESRQGLGIFLFTTASKLALGPTQPPTQWVPAALYLGVKRLGRESNHSHPSSTEVKNAWSYTSISPIRLHDVVLS